MGWHDFVVHAAPTPKNRAPNPTDVGGDLARRLDVPLLGGFPLVREVRGQ